MSGAGSPRVGEGHALSGAEPTSLSRSILEALTAVRRSPQTQRRRRGGEGGGEGTALADGSSARGYAPLQNQFHHTVREEADEWFSLSDSEGNVACPVLSSIKKLGYDACVSHSRYSPIRLKLTVFIYLK